METGERRFLGGVDGMFNKGGGDNDATTRIEALHPQKGKTILDELSPEEKQKIEDGKGTNREQWNKYEKTWEKDSHSGRPNKKIDGTRTKRNPFNQGSIKQQKETSEEVFEMPKAVVKVPIETKANSLNIQSKFETPIKKEPPLRQFDQLRQDIDDGVINVFEESIFPVPSFEQEITAVTMISRSPIDIGKMFAAYPKDFAILVTPGKGNERFISLILNRNSKIQDKPVLMKLLAKEIIRMDQTVKDSEKKWQAREDKTLVSGFTTSPVKGFLETLAVCLKNIKPESGSGVITAEKSDAKIVATV